MNHFNDEQIRKLVRNSIAPVGEQELRRDLWPEVLEKLPEQGVHVAWFDWVLAAAAVILCLSVPETILGLLFHL